MIEETERSRNLSEIRFRLRQKIPVAGKRIVDVGCGEGKALLQAESEGALYCVGVEVDPIILKNQWGLNFQELRHHLGWKKKIRSEVVHIPQDGRLPIKDSSTDVVICSFVFPYAQDKLRLFGKILRILAPMGSAYFLNTENLQFYTSLDKAWSNAFLVVDRKHKERLEKLKDIVEARELTAEGWTKETNQDAYAFGRMLDEGIETSNNNGEFAIGDMQVQIVNFYLVFEKLVKKCKKLELKKSGIGAMLQTSESYEARTSHKAIARVEKAMDYFILNMNLGKQDNTRAIPSILTILDARILD